MSHIHMIIWYSDRSYVVLTLSLVRNTHVKLAKVEFDILSRSTLGHSLFGSVFRRDFRWVLNSDWGERSAKKWSRCFVSTQRFAESFAETELRTERSL